MTINITGPLPNGMAQKIKEVASEFDFAFDGEEQGTGQLVLEFSDVSSSPQVHIGGNTCTSCEG